MTTCLTFRDCPVELAQALKKRAAANKRSINAEGLLLLRESLVAASRLSETELRRRLKAIRAKDKVKGLTVDEIRSAIREGRR